MGLREGRERAAFPEVRLGMAPLGVFGLIPSAQATAKTRAGGQVQHLALAGRGEDRAHRPSRDQGELLWATKGVWRLRTSGSWSHFPTLFFASESPQRTLKTVTAGRFCESPAAAVHFSPPDACWGRTISRRPFLASSPAGDQARSVHLVEAEAGGFPSGQALGLRAATCKTAQTHSIRGLLPEATAPGVLEYSQGALQSPERGGNQWPKTPARLDRSPVLSLPEHPPFL